MSTISDLHERLVTLDTKASTQTKIFFFRYISRAIYLVSALIGCNLPAKNSQSKAILASNFSDSMSEIRFQTGGEYRFLFNRLATIQPKVDKMTLSFENFKKVVIESITFTM